MESNSSAQSTGIGFTSLLAIAFIVLKLCKVIAWSWLWVLAPIWMPLALVVLLLMVYAALKYFDYKKAIRKTEVVKEIMQETGLNAYAAERKYNEDKGIPVVKSKWQQRMEEMQNAQKRIERQTAAPSTPTAATPNQSRQEPNY